VNCTANCAILAVLKCPPSPFPLPLGERVFSSPSLDGRGMGRVILDAMLNAADYSAA
jgi:hypothetical protein